MGLNQSTNYQGRAFSMIDDEGLLDQYLNRARRITGDLLVSQTRLCGETTNDHCERVGKHLVELARPLGIPRYLLTVCAGILHDVLEDTVDWNDPASYAQRRMEILGAFNPEILRIVEAVTVDQRLPPERQFAIFLERARNEFQIPELLIKWADIVDNWQTRYVYELHYRSCWEAYAQEMMTVIIPAGLRKAGWSGHLPPPLT